MANLRTVAESDLRYIVEQDPQGPRWPLTVTNPDGVALETYCVGNDIAQAIDPETGELVSGRSSSVSLVLRTLLDAGLGIPEGIADESKKPWLVATEDVNGISYTFAIQQTNPDRTLGLVTCLLETYVP